MQRVLDREEKMDKMMQREQDHFEHSNMIIENKHTAQLKEAQEKADAFALEKQFSSRLFVDKMGRIGSKAAFGQGKPSQAQLGGFGMSSAASAHMLAYINGSHAHVGGKQGHGQGGAMATHRSTKLVGGGAESDNNGSSSPTHGQLAMGGGMEDSVYDDNSPGQKKDRENEKRASAGKSKI